MMEDQPESAGIEPTDFKLPLVAKIGIFAIPVWAINAYAFRLGLWQYGPILSALATGVIVWQWDKLISLLLRLRFKAVHEYHVKPGLFAILYATSFIPFYLGLFLIAQGAVEKSWLLVAIGALINRLAFAMPYLYPLFWGKLPRKLTVAVYGWLVISLVFFVTTRLAA